MTKIEKKCTVCEKKHYAKGFCRSCYQKHLRDTDIEYKKRQNASAWKAKTCKILKEHHEDMKDDPEHLTTEFMQRIIGIKCKVEDE